jgi:predicted AAA+ superfamily ATPase
MDEEVVESWGTAVKALRISNGLEYEKYGKSEYKYRMDVVREICKKLPPILKWKTDDIQGYERLCKMAWSMFERNESCEYLGLYGMAGAGKSTLCKAMCSYSQGEFGVDIYRVELTSDHANVHLAEHQRLLRLQRVLQQMAVDSRILERVSDEKQETGVFGYGTLSISWVCTFTLVVWKCEGVWGGVFG